MREHLSPRSNHLWLISLRAPCLLVLVDMEAEAEKPALENGAIVDVHEWQSSGIMG